MGRHEQSFSETARKLDAWAKQRGSALRYRTVSSVGRRRVLVLLTEVAGPDAEPGRTSRIWHWLTDRQHHAGR